MGDSQAPSLLIVLRVRALGLMLLRAVPSVVLCRLDMELEVA